MRTRNYNFDIDKHSLIKPVVIIRSGDHDIDTIRVTLSEQGDPVDLTKATVKFMGTTPVGNKIIDDVHIKIVDATTGIFEYTFPSAAGASVGEYQDAYFTIVMGNGQTSTMNFRIQVLSGVDISAPAASDYVSHYNTMVANLNSAYDSATAATNTKMAATVSSVATSASTVLNSALARVATVNSQANNASSTANNAVSMASSVASAVTSQASYINSVASSAAADVNRALDKLNNLYIGGRNYILNSKHALSGSGPAQDTGWVDTSIPISALSNSVFTISAQVDYDNVTSSTANSRIGFEIIAAIVNNDGSTTAKYLGSWRNNVKVGESFHGRVSQTFNMSGVTLKSVYTPSRFGGGLYIQGVTATNISVSNPKIEFGNVASDWTPAPEDANNTFLKKTRELPAEASDFNYLALHMETYQGTWWNGDGVVSNAPDENWAWSSIEVICGNGEHTGVIRTSRFASWFPAGHTYVATVDDGKIAHWTLLANDANVVHKSGDTMTGNLTAPQVIANDLLTGFHNVIQVPMTTTKIIDLINNDFIKSRGFWKEQTFIAYNTVLSDAPTNDAYSMVKLATRGVNRTYIEYSDLSGNVWHNTASTNTLGAWVKQANDAEVVHNTINETVAGDKTFTGNTTLANIKSSNVKTGSVKLGGLTINFRETAVGVNVFMDGSWQGSFSMGDAYVDSGSIPTSISNPRQNVVLNIIGNAGVGGVTTNSPFKLEVLITTEGKVKYRSKNLRDNDTASRTATIVGAASTFYSLD